ncbi:8100_t:CDS:2 [Ambispora leptoticha]|uniref:8100_t:CDS:1 n=1 Tax=Ambispora leptoticha TaxID=144679 RepID=A0A9N8VF66_9GLOM|nr:8100_t:CDS:2 [Ambispora leptoticha]
MSDTDNTANYNSTTIQQQQLQVSTGADIWLGALFIGAAIALTIHSACRMYLLRMATLKSLLIIMCNVLLFLVELNTLLQVYSVILHMRNYARITSVVRIVNDIFFIFLEPSILYLAYQRCEKEYQAYTKHKKVHYTLFAFRGLTLILLFFSDLLSAVTTTTSIPSIFTKMEQSTATIPKIYYIASEIIFIRILLERSNREFANKKEYRRMKNYCSLQAIFFKFDTFLLSTALTYRVIYLLVSSTVTIPTFYYADILSIAFTLFLITEYGLRIPQLKRQTTRKSAFNDNNTISNHVNQAPKSTTSSTMISPTEDSEIEIDPFFPPVSPEYPKSPNKLITRNRDECEVDSPHVPLFNTISRTTTITTTVSHQKNVNDEWYAVQFDDDPPPSNLEEEEFNDYLNDKNAIEMSIMHK